MVAYLVSRRYCSALFHEAHNSNLTIFTPKQSCCLIPNIISHCLLVTEHTQHRRSSTTGLHRNLCLHFMSRPQSTPSCGFHDSCIDSLLPCGRNGFARSYARHRCNRLRTIRQSSSNCANCLHHQAVVDWALNSERCLQSELFYLAQSWVNKTSNKQTTRPDPPECLHFEREALQKLSTCYSRHSSAVCQLVNSASVDTITSDLTKVMNAFTKNDYYTPAVRSHLVEMLSSCNNNTATDTIVESIFPSEPNKILFCAASSGQSPVNMVKSIAGHLGRDFNQFAYAGRGDVNSNGEYKANSICRVHAPNGLGLLKNYQLILWSPKHNDTAQIDSLIGEIERAHTIHVDSTTTIKYFIYRTDKSLSNSCGNGHREAGELCDVFANTGMTNFGCDEQCMPVVGYECSLFQFENSTCQPTVCGDGKRTSDEECDAGSEQVGCSSNCKRQDGFVCSQNFYNSKSVCKAVPSESTTSSIAPQQLQQQQQQSSPSDSSSQHTATSATASSQHLSATSSSSSHWRTHSLLSGLLPVLTALLVGQAFFLGHR